MDAEVWPEFRKDVEGGQVNGRQVKRGRVLVKFCGFMDAESARIALDLGVDALGFNFYAGSRRALPWPAAGEWIDRLPRTARRVAVLVRPSNEIVHEMAASGIFDVLQFHGGESPAFCRLSPLPYIRAGTAGDECWADFSEATWLVDAAAPGEYGGTGRLADWAGAASLVQTHPEQKIFLAGGLHPENVAEALRRVRPYGVDVAGGVESAPGRKDATLMEAFLREVRRKENEELEDG